MLLGAPVVRTLVRDRGDDRGLLVIPTMYRDACLFAHARLRTIGRDQQRRRDSGVIAERHCNTPTLMLEPCHRGRAQRDPLRARLCGKRRSERRVLDHVGKRLTRFDLTRKGEKHRPHRVLQSGVGHHHVEDRLRLVGNRVPHIERLEHAPRRRRDRGGAQIGPRIRRDRRIRHHDAERFAEPLAKRERQREAGEAAARDHHIGFLVTHSCNLPPFSAARHRALTIAAARRVSAASAAKSPLMSAAVQTMLDVLNIEQLEVNLFRGRSPQDRWQRVFGGQVIGPALVAASRTVEGRPPHSLHCYFLIGGDPKVPIIYEVDRIRDGKSFTTRRVVAIQHGQAIFTLMVSFHIDEPGLEHQAPMPQVPPPEELPSEAEITAKVLPNMPEAVQRYYKSERPIELRPVEYKRYLGQKTENGFHVWIKATGPLPDDPAIHQCVLAYASDMSLLDTALAPHGRSLFEKEFM